MIESCSDSYDFSTYNETHIDDLMFSLKILRNIYDSLFLYKNEFYYNSLLCNLSIIDNIECNDSYNKYTYSNNFLQESFIFNLKYSKNVDIIENLDLSKSNILSIFNICLSYVKKDMYLNAISIIENSNLQLCYLEIAYIYLFSVYMSHLFDEKDEIINKILNFVDNYYKVNNALSFEENIIISSIYLIKAKFHHFSQDTSKAIDYYIKSFNVNSSNVEAMYYLSVYKLIPSYRIIPMVKKANYLYNIENTKVLLNYYTEKQFIINFTFIKDYYLSLNSRKYIYSNNSLVLLSNNINLNNSDISNDSLDQKHTNSTKINLMNYLLENNDYNLLEIESKIYFYYKDYHEAYNIHNKLYYNYQYNVSHYSQMILVLLLLNKKGDLYNLINHIRHNILNIKENRNLSNKEINSLITHANSSKTKSYDSFDYYNNVNSIYFFGLGCFYILNKNKEYSLKAFSYCSFIPETLLLFNSIKQVLEIQEDKILTFDKGISLFPGNCLFYIYLGNAYFENQNYTNSYVWYIKALKVYGNESIDEIIKTNGEYLINTNNQNCLIYSFILNEIGNYFKFIKNYKHSLIFFNSSLLALNYYNKHTNNNDNISNNNNNNNNNITNNIEMSKLSDYVNSNRILFKKEYISILINKASIYRKTKNIKEALNTLNEAYFLDKNNIECLNSLGFCYMLLKKYDKAIEFFFTSNNLNSLNQFSSNMISYCNKKLL